MELKTLWLGLLISLGAFAVKTGLGWAYLWARLPAGRRAPASLALLAGYALMFGAVYGLVSSVNLLAHYEILLPLWRGGVTLHWLLAGLLLLWGLSLMRSRDDGRSRGWLALVIPCPVCLSVALMSVAGLVLFFPGQAPAATAALFAAFAALATTAGLAAAAGGRMQGGSLQSALGLAMVLMALYFILSALLMPQFAELDRVYRLALYSEEGRTGELKSAGAVFGAVAALAAGGFIFAKPRSGNGPASGRRTSGRRKRPA